MKWAYFGVPHFGGTYTVYASLRKGLAAHGIEVRWVGVGAKAQQMFGDPDWRHEWDTGEVVDSGQMGDRALAARLTEHLIARRYDGVMVNVLADKLQMNAVRFIPERMVKVMIVHSISPGTYAAARALRDHVHVAVGVSERIRSDLTRKCGFESGRVFAVLNGVDMSRFARLQRAASREGSFNLLSLGRLEDRSKGILWLPAIMRELAADDVTLTIAGDGPDRRWLEQACRDFSERVSFVGSLPPSQVPALMCRMHAFVLPSRFEGFGQTLVEAMAAGCVPVASHIRGVTDTIIEHGETGFLFPVGDTRAAAEAIRILARDRVRLERMSRAARESVRGRFDLERQARAYAAIIRAITEDPPPIAPPLPFHKWHYPRGLRPGLRTYLPEPVKNVLRVWRERLAS